MPLAPLQARYRQQAWTLPGALSPEDDQQDRAFNPRMESPTIEDGEQQVEQFPPAAPKAPMPAPPAMEAKAAMPPPGSDELGPESGPEAATHDKPEKPHAEPAPVDDTEAAATAPTPSKPPSPRDAALAKTQKFSTPTVQHSNWAQRLGMAVLSATKLAPYANQIVHPKWSEEERARKANLAGAEQELKDVQGAELGEAQTRHATAQATLAEQQAATLEREGKRAPKQNYIAVGGGLFDAEAKEWVKQPVDKTQITAIPKEQAVEWGIAPLADGTYGIPHQAVGAYLTGQRDKSVKTIEERVVQVMSGDGPPEQKQQKIDDLVKAHNLLHPQSPIHGIETDGAGNSTLVVADPAHPQSVQKIPLGPIGKREKPSDQDHGTNVVDPTSNTIVRVLPGEKMPGGATTTTQFGAANAPTTASRTVADQAKAIRMAGDNLIKEIDAKKGKVGNLGSYWNQVVNQSPISDKDVSGLMASISSFAALQPKLHGFRSHDAMREFANIIGGVPKDAEALKAAIRSIQNTAEIMERMGKIQVPGETSGGSGTVDELVKKYGGR